jgi:hypothetical protein
MQDAAAQWAHNPLVSGVATYAYRPSVMRGLTGKEDLITARVTPEMFQLLGTGAVLGHLFNPDDADQVVLSNAMWRRRFLADAGIIGRHFYLNHRRVEVVGVLPDGFRIPGIDVDMFMSFTAGEGPGLRGFEWPGVVFRLANGVPADQAKRELQKYVNQTRFPTPIFFDVLSAKDLRYRAISSWGAVTFFAVLMIVAFNGRAVVALCSKNPRRTVAEACRWWLFFVVKSALLIAVVLLASMDVVQIAVQRFGLNAYDYAGGAVTWIFVVGLTIAVTWSIRDQGARCRTCLKLLRTETFLGARFGPLHAPSGFELVCDKGHGALHIPVTWVSCLDSERWTEFDDSWRELAQNA